MPYAKALLAIVVSAVGALVVALGPGNNHIGDLSTRSWLIAIGTVLGGGGLVWFAENVSGAAGGIIKTVLAFLSAGISSLVVALDDNVISQTEMLTAFSVAVVATGLVYQVANTDSRAGVRLPTKTAV